MASFSGLASFFWPRADRRSAHEIEADIRDELRFHVDEATDALVASGLEREVARERALAKFGDIEHVRGACRRVQLGDRIMLQRIQWVVIAVLVFAVVALGFQTVSLHRRELEAREMAMAQMQEAQAAQDFLNAALADAQAGRATAEDVMRVAAERVEQDPRAAVWSSMKFDLDGQESIDAWLKLLKTDLNTWRQAITVGEEIAKTLTPKSALQAMQTLYPELSLEQRQQIFKPFIVDGGHPMAVQILKLGVFDAEPKMRGRACFYLGEYAFEDLSEWRNDDIAAWYARVGEMPLAQLFEDSARALVTRLAASDVKSDEFAKQMRLLMSLKFDAARKYDPQFGAQLGNAGLLAQIRNWSASDNDDLRIFALRAASWLALDANRLRSEVLLPMERNPEPATPAVWNEYCNLIGQRGDTWATTALIERYRSVLASGGHGGDLFAPATALAKIGDTSVIPKLIDLLATNDTPDNRYAIGYFALRELTGVAWDESHGAAWWSDWWAKNYEMVGGRNAAKNALERLTKDK